MSAAGRGAYSGGPAEFFPTPAWCVRRLLEAVALPGGRWLEPSAGDGAIIHAVNAARSDVEWAAIEIREECRAPLAALTPLVTITDFLAAPACFDPGATVAILNPPFSLALPFVERLLGMAEWVAMLQRTNWLETDERNAFLRAHAPDLYVLPNRPSFTGDGGTDATSYAWMVWPAGGHDRSEGRLRVLPSTSAEERAADPRQVEMFAAVKVPDPQASLFGGGR